jgi:hypothetical protein
MDDVTAAPAANAMATADRIGVLLVNLGTPDATDYRSMRRYLKEFLSDTRVVEDESLTWKLVFNGFIRPSGRAPRAATTTPSGTASSTSRRSRPSPVRRRRSSPQRSRPWATAW